MTIYSKIATLHYADKNIKLKLQIRIKLVEIRGYTCNNTKKNCYIESQTLKNIVRWVKRSKYSDSSGYIEMSSKEPNVPKIMLNKKDEMLCPICKKKLVVKPLIFIKLFCKPNNPLIEYAKILARYTCYRWANKPGYMHSNEYYVFLRPDIGVEESIKKMYENDLNYYDRINSDKNKPINMHLTKKSTVKFEIHKPVTVDILNKELQTYKDRKLLRVL